MVVYTLREVGLQSIYRRCRFWQKNIFSDEAHFELGGYVKTSKIVAFGAQKTRTRTLKNRSTQNESMSGAAFGPEA